MQLTLKTPIEELIPKLIEFNNEEIIINLKPQLEYYKKIVYTDQDLPIAKMDRAKLNKFKETIENERKRIKKTYLMPYEKFENQVKEITALVDETAKIIDTQVKVFEDNKKVEKKQEIITFWSVNIGNLRELIPIEKVFSEQWLNTSYSLKKVQEDITNFIAKVKQDLDVISSLNFKQENYLKDFYLRTFDLALTLQEKIRLEEVEKRIAEFSPKQALERTKQEETIKHSNEDIITVDFRIWATKGQIEMLREFLIKSNIKYGNVPKSEV